MLLGLPGVVCCVSRSSFRLSAAELTLGVCAFISHVADVEDFQCKCLDLKPTFHGQSVELTFALHIWHCTRVLSTESLEQGSVTCLDACPVGVKPNGCMTARQAFISVCFVPHNPSTFHHVPRKQAAAISGRREVRGVIGLMLIRMLKLHASPCLEHSFPLSFRALSLTEQMLGFVSK